MASSATISETCDRLKKSIADDGPQRALDALADELRAEGRLHELFEVRKMQARHRLGLPVVSTAGLDELPEDVRTQVEDAYIEACREVGMLFLEERRIREAWEYLRVVGDRRPLAEALEQTEPDEESLEELIEVALHHGVAPVRGFELVLEHYGTCNAITTFEGTMPYQPVDAQRAAAKRLVRHLHAELTANVRAHVEDRGESAPADATLADLVAQHPWLFENDNYHIDTSHLSSTVRFARLVDDREIVRLAWELTEYGRRLAEQFQYAGEPPFEAMYPSHGLLFAATLDERVDEAIDHFRNQAESTSIEEEGTAAVETYLVLLARLGRFEEALEAIAELVPPGTPLSPYCPQIMDLARQAGKLDRYLEICRDRDDVLAYAAGLIERESRTRSQPI